jgi:hypothetical protein
VKENLVYLNHHIRECLSFGEVCHFGARLYSVVFMLKLNSVKIYNYVL